jgi:hypothetical protein
MGQNFVAGDRGQTFLLPPSLMDCLPEDHLVLDRARRGRGDEP